MSIKSETDSVESVSSAGKQREWIVAAAALEALRVSQETMRAHDAWANCSLWRPFKAEKLFRVRRDASLRADGAFLVYNAVKKASTTTSALKRSSPESSPGG